MVRKIPLDIKTIYGLGITAIIASSSSHGITGIHAYFSSFALAIFYILAGATSAQALLSLDYNVVGDIKEKSKHFFVPYLVWSVVTVVIPSLIKLVGGAQVSSWKMLSVLIGENPFGGYRFLWSLFMIFVIFAFVSRMNQSAVALMILSTILYSFYLIFDVYYCVTILKYSIFFTFGILIDRYSSVVLKLMRARILQSIIFYIAVLGAVYHFSSVKWLYIFTAVAGSWATFCLGSFISEKAPNVIKTPIKELGEYCYDIFLFYYPISLVFQRLFPALFTNHPLPAFALLFSAGIIIPYILSKYIFRHIPIIRTAFLGYKTLNSDSKQTEV